MRVLFVTRYRVIPTKGGTERITFTIAQGLRDNGINVFSAYIHNIIYDYTQSVFLGEYNISRFHIKRDLEKIISGQNIDVIIFQGEFQFSDVVRRIKKKINCKVFFVHHYAPGWEEQFISLQNIYHTFLINDRQSRIDAIKNLLLYPLHRYRAFMNRFYYRKVYRIADKVILLSNRFKSEFIEYAKLKEGKKIISIPNALSYDYFLPKDDIYIKENVVLIVARLEERQKNISAALRIWRRIIDNITAEKWNLIIVGTGPNLVEYENYVRKNNISNIKFVGHKDPADYYKTSAIFMMTSRSEGWGLTLTEAQQFGCVPIAFDTYASLHDIIKHDETGVIISDLNNEEEYAKQLQRLMNDRQFRETLAINAIKSSKQFSSDLIVKKWIKVINS